MKAAEIRQGFLDFFAERGHTFVPSSPVIPQNDPTILFTNAGMNQFKDVFLGTGSRDYTRAVNSQKCIRISGKHNDLEEVGRDTYHHTFFEMLGNWSFGDYYKEEAIAWAWELLTDVWGLPKERLYATIHHSDAESGEIWADVTDIDPDRILTFGDEDNFWEMGDVGPCGPCSEIHFDRGEAADPGRTWPEGHGVNQHSQRFIELWNLVFIQYDRQKDGTLKPLPAKHVDTGMGFERITAVLQDELSNYGTDVFAPIFEHLAELTGHRHEGTNSVPDVASRVIADHIRALTFALADGAIPSNTGRGYEMRKVLRRAARHGKNLGQEEPFLHKLVPTLVEQMGDVFPSIAREAPEVTKRIRREEENFLTTLERGRRQFRKIVDDLPEEVTEFPAEEAAKLKTTHGYPLDLTTLDCEEQDLDLDLKAAREAIRKQRETGGQGGDSPFEARTLDPAHGEVEPTIFIGHDPRNLMHDARVLSFHEPPEGPAELILDRTAFYAEAGGQVGDTGFIEGNGWAFEVTDTQTIRNAHVHYGSLSRGTADQVEGTCRVAVDVHRRERIQRNHTATHLLHWALHEVLGEHATQQGSLVAPDRLRFDFRHDGPVTDEERHRLEELINDRIMANLPVTTAEMELDQALEAGAMALFGEKYDDEVRVVSIGDFSKELCGGTHVVSTGSLGPVHIVQERPVQSGVRRIVALSGETAVDRIMAGEERLRALSRTLNVPEEQLVQRVESLLDELRETQNDLKQLKAERARKASGDLLEGAEEKGGVQWLCRIAPSFDQKQLGIVADRVKGMSEAFVGAFISGDGRLVVAASEGARKRDFTANALIRALADEAGGGGGGRDDFAQGKLQKSDPGFLKEAWQRVVDRIVGAETS